MNLEEKEDNLNGSLVVARLVATVKHELVTLFDQQLRSH